MKLKQENAAYIAGFVDGDGSINAQIVRRPDYRLKFQIRVTLTFFQKTKRYHFLKQLQKELKIGTCRKRNDGMAEYTIVGKQSVRQILQEILPYLRIKKRQAILVREICNQTRKEQTEDEFIESCLLVDKIAELNDSKKRIITASTVRTVLRSIEMKETPSP